MACNRFSPDCKHWIGYKPCDVQKRSGQRDCRNCNFHSSYSENVLIIEAGGLGSVLRTSVVAQEFKKRGAKVQWLTNKRGFVLLQNVPCVDNVFDLEDWSSSAILGAQKFNILINFESTPLALALARKFKAKAKRGFQADSMGNLSVARADGTEFLQLQIDDVFRKRENRKPMQQILLEIAGFDWEKQKYQLKTNEEDDAWARGFLREMGIAGSDFILGFNIGSSVRQKKKRWPIREFIDLADILSSKRPDWKIVVLAGPDEEDIYEEFNFASKNNSSRNLFFSGYSNTIGQFISLVNCLSLVVSCDTFGMHVAIAMDKKVVTLHGPQPIQEIELYGLGKKIWREMDCAPCFLTKKDCQANCMHIAASFVAEEIFGLL